MKTSFGSVRRFEFCEPRLDLLIEVEETGDGVIVRATRDVLTGAQKAAFLRRIAAEGFISDSHRWRDSAGTAAEVAVRWVIDASWLALTPEMLAISRRFMIRLFIGAGSLWAVLMLTLVVRSCL